MVCIISRSCTVLQGNIGKCKALHIAKIKAFLPHQRTVFHHGRGIGGRIRIHGQGNIRERDRSDGTFGKTIEETGTGTAMRSRQ